MKKLFSLAAAVLLTTSLFAIDGALSGLFTVHKNGMQVRFSQGNLQYGDDGTHVADDGNTLSGTWRFAATQYESIGYKETKEGDKWVLSVNKKDGFRDMFHWASSGYKGVGPDYDVQSESKYGDGTNQISKSWWDWGWYNPITNGGNVTRTWRTLTMSEMKYIYYFRNDAANLRSQGKVCGVKGYIFLPDGWTETPAGAPEFKPEDSSMPCDWTHNVYDKDQWDIMEKAGAVFFPISIERHNSDESMSYYGGYWAGTPKESYAEYWTFQGCSNTFGEYTRYYDANVRLVLDVMDPSAVEQMSAINCQLSTKKVLKEGRLYIEHNGQIYNAQGAKVH